jgi:hypothetical protein
MAPVEPTDVRTAYPSLRDRPCEYPDARPARERWPFLYHHSLAYPLAPDPDLPVTLPDLAIRTERGVETIAAWLQAAGATPVDQRIPVLAAGSNVYPRQLADKFLLHPVADDSVITLPCRMRGLRVVYAAALSINNGYVPVTVQHAPTVETSTWIQWLSADQLRAISATEGRRYALVECPGDGLTVPGLRELPSAVYAWRHDAVLDLGDGPIGYAADRPDGPGSATEADVLHDVVAQFIRLQGLQVRGASLTWDGCAPPVNLRDTLRDFIAERAQDNPLPPEWRVIDRADPEFATHLLPN